MIERLATDIRDPDLVEKIFKIQFWNSNECRGSAAEPAIINEFGNKARYRSRYVIHPPGDAGQRLSDVRIAMTNGIIVH